MLRGLGPPVLIAILLAFPSLGCFGRLEPDVSETSTLRVLEDGELLHLRTVGLWERGIFRVPGDVYLYEMCPAGEEFLERQPPCWPVGAELSQRQIRESVRRMPEYRHPETLATVAAQAGQAGSDDNRIRVVLGTRPLIVGIEARRSRGDRNWAYIAQEDALDFRIVAMAVLPDFGGGVESPLVIEFDKPRRVAEVLELLEDGADWAALGQVRKSEDKQGDRDD